MKNTELKTITGEEATAAIDQHAERFVQAYAEEMAGVTADTRSQVLELIGPEAQLSLGIERRKAKYEKVIAESKKHNSLVLVKSGEEMAAIGRYLPVPNKVNLFEMGSIYTYPNFRGQGLSKQVRSAILRQILEKHGPEATVILATKSDAIKGINAGPECTTIGYKEYLDRCGYDYTPDALQKDLNEGWVGIVIDLKKIALE